MPQLHSIRWHPRTTPLVPVGIAAQGTAASALAHRLLLRTDDELSLLRGVSSPGLLVLSGASELLPWVDGALYLGQDQSAPLLLMPTMLTPSVPPALLERALCASYSAAPAPIAVLSPWRRLASMQGARAIQAECLRAWLVKEG